MSEMTELSAEAQPTNDLDEGTVHIMVNIIYNTQSVCTYSN